MLARIGRLVFVGQLGLGLLIGWAIVRASALSGFGAALANVLLAIVFLLVTYALVVLTTFALAAATASARPAEHRLSWFGAVCCYVREWASSVQTFMLRQPWFGDQTLASAPRNNAGSVPIVFIHGYFCNRALWRPAAAWFAARGHAVGSVNLEPVFGSISEYPRVIDAAIRELQQRSGATQVALVCHSMGGLAARAYVRDFGSTALAKIITLGTPHQGTSLANFSVALNVREMRPTSPWRDQLAAVEQQARDDWRDGLYTVILSHHDNIVSPQAKQTIPGAKTLELSGIGHVRLALEPAVWEHVRNELALTQGTATRAAAAAL